MESLPHVSLVSYFRPVVAPRLRRYRRTSRYFQRPPPPYALHTIPEGVSDEEARVESVLKREGEDGFDTDDNEDGGYEDEDDEETGRGCCAWGIGQVAWVMWILLTVGVWAWSMAVLMKNDEVKANEVSAPSLKQSNMEVVRLTAYVRV